MIGRIRAGTTFERLRRDGRVVRHGLLEIRYLLDGGGDPPRVAFAVARSTGSAVVRNRLRRRLRAVMRELADPARLPALPSGAYLIRARRNAGTAGFARLQQDAERLLERIVEGGDAP
ncbi:MAG: ribonuclease P protein component [bacterium]|nr:ribonuclease P protein component [bacterium]